MASAGNHEGKTLHYPASFDIDNVISVGGTDADGQPVPAWGHIRKVHISAPGTAVYSTIPTRIDERVPYMVNSGTSPAAALVAGACALLKSYAIANGLSTNNLTIRTALIDSATPFTSGAPGDHRQAQCRGGAEEAERAERGSAARRRSAAGCRSAAALPPEHAAGDDSSPSSLT